MTIDEAISHAREVSEYKRKKIDKCSKKNNYACRFCDETKTCLECAEEHEQIAEWLEELKFRRVLQLQVEKEFFAGYKNGKKEGYNKAIDDFKKILTIEKIKEYAESDGFININNCSLMILDIAEQLKAGDAK